MKTFHVTQEGEGYELSPFMRAAGAYTALGLFPIPLRGKRPVIDWKKLQGRALADRDWDEVDRYRRSWWDPERLDSGCAICGTNYPWGHAMDCHRAPREPVARVQSHNIGVLTGAEIFIDSEQTRHLVVVDVDDREAHKLVEKICGWPRTPTVKTYKGWHLWFTYGRPVGNRAKVDGVGLDVRGAGGYVVVPPSRHPSGEHVYEWEVGISWAEDDRRGMWPPAPMPIELAEFLFPARPAVDGRGAAAPILTTRYIETALEREVAAVSSATEGARNDQLNRSAFALARFVRDGSLPAGDFVEQLTSAALRTGLPEPEIRRTLASALQGRS